MAPQALAPSAEAFAPRQIVDGSLMGRGQKRGIFQALKTQDVNEGSSTHKPRHAMCI